LRRLSLRRYSGALLIPLALTVTFAAFDWVMSLAPHWYSTIFGVYAFAGGFVAGIALLSVVAAISTADAEFAPSTATTRSVPACSITCRIRP